MERDWSSREGVRFGMGTAEKEIVFKRRKMRLTSPELSLYHFCKVINAVRALEESSRGAGAAPPSWVHAAESNNNERNGLENIMYRLWREWKMRSWNWLWNSGVLHDGWIKEIYAWSDSSDLYQNPSYKRHSLARKPCDTTKRSMIDILTPRHCGITDVRNTGPIGSSRLTTGQQRSSSAQYNFAFCCWRSWYEEGIIWFRTARLGSLKWDTLGLSKSAFRTRMRPELLAGTTEWAVGWESWSLSWFAALRAIIIYDRR